MPVAYQPRLARRRTPTPSSARYMPQVSSLLRPGASRLSSPTTHSMRRAIPSVRSGLASAQPSRRNQRLVHDQQHTDTSRTRFEDYVGTLREQPFGCRYSSLRTGDSTRAARQVGRCWLKQLNSAVSRFSTARFQRSSCRGNRLVCAAGDMRRCNEATRASTRSMWIASGLLTCMLSARLSTAACIVCRSPQSRSW